MSRGASPQISYRRNEEGSPHPHTSAWCGKKNQQIISLQICALLEPMDAGLSPWFNAFLGALSGRRQRSAGRRTASSSFSHDAPTPRPQNGLTLYRQDVTAQTDRRTGGSFVCPRGYRGLAGRAPHRTRPKAVITASDGGPRAGRWTRCGSPFRTSVRSGLAS